MQKDTNVSLALKSQAQGSQMYDHSIKILLADKQVLSRILKYSVEEFSDMTIDEIMEGIVDTEVGVHPLEPTEAAAQYGSAETFSTEDYSPGEGTIVYDIRCKVYVRDRLYFILVNLEAQRTTDPLKLKYHIENRVVYYLSRMVSGQKNHEFYHDDYDSIRKCVSIWICLADRDEEESIEEFMLTKIVRHGKSSKINCPDLLRGVIIKIRQRDEFSNSKDKLISMLEDLISKTETESKIGGLVSKHGFVDTVDIQTEVGHMCNFSEALIEEGIERGIEKGLKEGFERGRTEGLEKGMENGLEKGKFEMIIKALDKLSEAEVKNIFDITDEEIAKAKSMLAMA